MALLDRDVAHAFGVSRDANPAILARALLRLGGAQEYDMVLPPAVATWLAQVANELGGALYSGPISVAQATTRATTNSLTRLKRHDAASALAILAPDQVIPSTTANELGKVCRALVRPYLLPICRRVLHEWVNLHLIEDKDREHPDDMVSGF